MTESDRHMARSEAFADFANILRATPDLTPPTTDNVVRDSIARAVVAGMNDQKELTIELAERLAQIERDAA